jgi:hypothetical protein
LAQGLKSPSLSHLAKYGHFDEFRRRASTFENLDLAEVFDRAVTDFRTVKRNSGHQTLDYARKNYREKVIAYLTSLGPQ